MNVACDNSQNHREPYANWIKLDRTWVQTIYPYNIDIGMKCLQWSHGGLIFPGATGLVADSPTALQ